MKVHAASLGFLALFATLGLVAAQNPPAGARPGKARRTGRGITGQGA